MNSINSSNKTLKGHDKNSCIFRHVQTGHARQRGIFQNEPRGAPDAIARQNEAAPANGHLRRVLPQRQSPPIGHGFGRQGHGLPQR